MLQPLQTCDGHSLWPGHVARAQQGLEMSGMESGRCLRTPAHDVVQLVATLQQPGSYNALRYPALSRAGVWHREVWTHLGQGFTGIRNVQPLWGGYGLSQLCFAMFSDSGRPGEVQGPLSGFGEEPPVGTWDGWVASRAGWPMAGAQETWLYLRAVKSLAVFGTWTVPWIWDRTENSCPCMTKLLECPRVLDQGGTCVLGWAQGALPRHRPTCTHCRGLLSTGSWAELGQRHQLPRALGSPPSSASVPWVAAGHSNPVPLLWEGRGLPALLLLPRGRGVPLWPGNPALLVTPWVLGGPPASPRRPGGSRPCLTMLSLASCRSPASARCSHDWDLYPGVHRVRPLRHLLDARPILPQPQAQERPQTLHFCALPRQRESRASREWQPQTLRRAQHQNGQPPPAPHVQCLLQ